MSVDFVDIIPNPKKPKKFHWPKIFKSKKFWIVTSISLLTLLIVVGWVFLQYRVISKDGDAIAASVGRLKLAVEKQNIEEVKKQNNLLRKDLVKAQKDLDSYSLFGKLPVFSGYWADANHLLKAAIVGTEAADIAVVVVAPFADVLGLEGHKGSTNAQQKAEIVVRQIIPELIPKIDQLSIKLKKIKTEVDQVNVNHYPLSLKIENLKVRDLLVKVKKELATIDALLPEVKPILQVLPEIAGSPSERNYLIIFQNDKELRPTGGFITSYAIAKVFAGRLVSITSADIANLDKKMSKKEPAPDFLAKYLKATEWAIRDANVYPDYKTSAQKFEEFYYRVPKVSNIDGIIAIDTEFVRRLLTMTGPIKSKKLKETFSAENNEKGIPDVVYKLELYVEKILANDPNHKGFIGELMNEVIAKVSAFSPEKFEPFLATVYQAAIEKHLLFYFDDKDAQKLVEKYNFAGRIKDYPSDYLHINNSNFGGLKSNLFVKFNIDQDIHISSDGKVTKTLTVSIKHTGKADNWLSANYGNWQRVYVPAGSKLLNKKVPRDYDFTVGKEIGKEVFRTYWETAPLKETKGTYVYELPFKIKKGEKYRLLMQKQPGDNFTTGQIRINGKLIKTFDLKQDQELEFAF